MYKVSELLRFIIFADDTNIFCLGDDPMALVNTVNNELKKLEAWFRVNKLSLNVSTSNYMMFGNKNKEVFVKHEQAPTAPKLEGVWVFVDLKYSFYENRYFWPI